MIKFFRKIRQSPLIGGRTTKYFKYAIGEIVLVVIGILIALQINNWNEARKSNQKLESVLKALKSDLSNDVTAINHHLKFSNMVVNASKKLLDQSRKESATLDTLVHLGKNKFRASWVSPIKFSNTTFESIKYSGDFELLSDSLRSAVTKLYNKQKYYLNNLETFNNEYKNRYYNFSQHYITSFINEKTYLAKTVSWQNINKKDFAVKFDGILSYRYELWRYYLEILDKQKRRTEQLIKLINNN